MPTYNSHTVEDLLKYGLLGATSRVSDSRSVLGPENLHL